MIDLQALKAEASLADSQGRKFCQVHVSELKSLISRAEMMQQVQGMVQFAIGYCSPDDVHQMLQRKVFRVGMQLKKGAKYSMRVMCMHIPSDPEKQVDATTQNQDSTPLQSDE